MIWGYPHLWKPPYELGQKLISSDFTVDSLVTWPKSDLSWSILTQIPWCFHRCCKTPREFFREVVWQRKLVDAIFDVGIDPKDCHKHLTTSCWNTLTLEQSNIIHAQTSRHWMKTRDSMKRNSTQNRNDPSWCSLYNSENHPKKKMRQHPPWQGGFARWRVPHHLCWIEAPRLY